MTPTQKSHITGIILAGGKSSRMGQEKGLVVHNNIPFITHITTAISHITTDIIISTANPTYEQFGYPCIKDNIPDCGPIGGIYTGLLHSQTELNLVLSCDVPFITPIAIQELISNHTSQFDGTCYHQTPLVGIYHTSITSVLQTKIKNRQLRVQEALNSLNIQSIPTTNITAHEITNINTLQHYKKAIEWK